MPRSLFRKEAIDAQRQKFLGEASVAQPPRLWMYTATAIAIAVIVVAYAIWGQYTRRERVQGYLASAVGAALVKMPDAGTLVDVMVREGEVVAKGAALAHLTVDRSGSEGDRTYQAKLREMQGRLKTLDDERAQAESLGRAQVDQMNKRIANLLDEVREVDGQIVLQKQRLDTANQLLVRWLDLQKAGHASEAYVLRYQAEAKEQELKVQDLVRQRATIRKDLQGAQSEVPSIRLKSQAQVEQLDRQSSDLRQSIEELASQREQNVRRDMLISAPIAGTVTNIAPAPGQTVAADAVLLTLLPRNDVLHAELLVPTRAIGFVHRGQRVTMRYDAYPYERFGQYAGTVDSVSKTVLTQSETAGPIAIREPMYRIVVDLDRQDIDANNQKFPLRAGIALSADLLMEKRSLVEWLFQPILQLRERMRAHE